MLELLSRPEGSFELPPQQLPMLVEETSSKHHSTSHPSSTQQSHQSSGFEVSLKLHAWSLLTVDTILDATSAMLSPGCMDGSRCRSCPRLAPAFMVHWPQAICWLTEAGKVGLGCRCGALSVQSHL